VLVLDLDKLAARKGSMKQGEGRGFSYAIAVTAIATGTLIVVVRHFD